MKMAVHGWLVAPVQGLLLCILALQLCVQDPCATADHNAVTKTASVAAGTISVAAHTTSAAIRTSLVAASVSSVAAHTTLVVANASSVAARTTSVATNASSVAISTSSVATSAASVATSAALVAVSTSSVATSTYSVVANASLVVTTNASVNSKEETSLTCQSFQCSGERCYQDEAHANDTVICHNEAYCELYRFSSTNYTARCSSTCGTEPCRTHSGRGARPCTLDCCNSSLCLQLNASSYGDLPPTTTPPTTTTQAPPRNGKVCAAFSCHGDGCFKGKKTVARCIVGQDFCEMKKTGLNYMAGCSRACKAAKPICASGVKVACYQECCPASPKASCLKLDGKVHVNSAGQVTLAPFLKLMACGVILLLSNRASASLWG